MGRDHSDSHGGGIERGLDQPLSPLRPRLSIVIPIHNEELILETAVRALTSKLHDLGETYELILAENGSSDATLEQALKLAADLPAVRVLSAPAPNYGRALRMGFEDARGEIVISDEIDLCDLGFYRAALHELAAGSDLVVGSKRHPQAHDARPWIRRRGTQVINLLLRLSLGFKGTDTHGPKAFVRTRLQSVVANCTVEHDLFASELVIRAMRAGLDVREVPLQLHEIRPPSIHLLRRVPRVLGNLAKLVATIRRGDRP